MKIKFAILLIVSWVMIFPAHAYNNDYRSSTYQDSYSQSWQSYKQQNNIKTESYVQQGWWNKAFNGVTNFLADLGSAINKTLNSIGSFFNNAYNSIKNIFIKTPDINTSTSLGASTNIDTATPQIKAIKSEASKMESNKPLTTAKIDATKAQNNKYATTNQKKNEPELAIDVFACAIHGEKMAEGDSSQAQEIKTPLESAADHASLPLTGQENIGVISPAQLKPADPGIISVGNQDNTKSTQIVRDIEQKQLALSRVKTIVADTIQFTREDWKNNNNLVDSTGKGLLEGFVREVKMDDTFTPVQQFFQAKSDQLDEVTVSALQGLDVAYNNPNSENGILQAVDKFSLATAKGCIIAGAMITQGILDVGKFGSEIPQVMASVALAKDNLKAGDTKAAMRNIGNAIGGVGREAMRATVIGSVGKSIVGSGKEFFAKLSAGTIPQKDLVNFASWRANKTVYKEGTVLYRLYDKNASGHWWTTQKPSSKLQWGIDQAVKPAWNSGERIAALHVPENKILVGWEGKASYQGDIYIGGGNQVYFKSVPDDWIVTDVFNK